MTKLIERLADSVPSWGARLAYGEKTTLDGHDLLPVAIVVFGFGGGYAIPIGAYIGGTRGPIFRPNPVAVIIAAAPLVSAAGLALARLLRSS
jgi:hypothetical protein